MIRDIAQAVEQDCGRKNLSEIAKRAELDRRTVKKYLDPNNLGATQAKRTSASILDEYKPYIQKRLNEYERISGRRLLRELKDKGYTGGYTILTDYLRIVRQESNKLAIYRYETKPGHQAQVDWGYLGKIALDGADRHLYVFTMILGYSRMRFVKFTLSMDVATLIKCHNEGFQYFGGIPEEILYDNMKAVIIKKGYTPNDCEFNATFKDFADYCGFIIRTCKPRMPKTKGKIENTVKYVKHDFYYGSSFSSFTDINNRAFEWMERVNHQVHETTYEVPYDRITAERDKMKDASFLLTYVIETTEKRKVSNDSYVSYLGNRYSVPYKYAGREVIIKAAGTTIRIYCNNEELCTHEVVPGTHHRIRVKEHFTGLLSETLKQNDISSYSSGTVMRFKEVEVENRSLDVYEEMSQGGRKA